MLQHSWSNSFHKSVWVWASRLALSFVPLVSLLRSCTANLCLLEALILSLIMLLSVLIVHELSDLRHQVVLVLVVILMISRSLLPLCRRLVHLWVNFLLVLAFLAIWLCC